MARAATASDARLVELFARQTKSIRARRQTYAFRFLSAGHWVDFFRTYYGPTLKAWDALDDAGRDSFREGIVALATEMNRATDGTLAVPSDYLEVVAFC